MPEEFSHDVQDLVRTPPNRYDLPLSTRSDAIPAIEATEDSVSLGALMAALWGRKALITGIAIAGMLAGLAVSLLATPTYRSRASVQLEGFNNDQFLREVAPISPSLPNASPDNLLQNAVKLLESDMLAIRVADKLGVQPAQETSGTLKVLPAPVRNFIRFLRPRPITAEEQRLAIVRRALSVRTSLQSQVIELFYDALDPHLAARGANAAAAQFVELNREARWQLAQDTTDWLNKQASDLKTTLEKSNQELQEFARSAGLVFAGKQSTLAEDRMRQVQDTLAKAEADRAAKQARYEAVEANPNVLITDPLSPGPVRQYQTDLQNLRRELAQLKTLYTPTNYKVQRVEAEITQTEKSIEQARQDELSRLRTEYLAAVGLDELLSQTEALQLKTVEQQMENERRYDVKKSEVEATQRLYEAMLEKVKEAGAASASRATNVRIIDGANTPSIPYSPNAMLNIALGFALGTMGGVGLALIFAAKDDKVKRPGESGLPAFPELGVVPSARFGEALARGDQRPAWFTAGTRELAAPARDRESSLWSESFRSVFTSILFSNAFHRESEGSDNGRILVVTSVDVMEGKTLVVTNLGIAAAETKRRVLLIDADLRRPRLHERLDLPNHQGLTDLLRGGNPADRSGAILASLVQQTQTPNLWVLSSGPVDDLASDLLYAHSSKLGATFQRLRKQFDLVLIDTPPLMFCADGRLLGKKSDGLVMVVRANRRSREELKSAYQQFIRDKIPVLGTILNDWKMDHNQSRSYKRYQVQYGFRGK